MPQACLLALASCQIPRCCHSVIPASAAAGHRRPRMAQRALTVVPVPAEVARDLLHRSRAGNARAGRLAAAGGGQQPGLLSARRIGQVYLLLVAVLWGSYGPTYRLIYSVEGAPQPIALTAVRAALQALLFILPAALATSKASTSKAGKSTDAPFLAGLELGVYYFGASSLQAVGLQQTTAVRAALLILASSLFTPLLAQLSGQKLGKEVWAACTVALAGAALIVTDTHGATAAVSAPGTGWLPTGELCMLGAAFCFSLATVRLGQWAKRVDGLPLARAKSGGIAGFAAAFLGADCLWRIAHAEPLTTLWPTWDSPVIWVALAWASIGPGALAAWLQTKGQSLVPAAEAQILFSLAPLPAGFFASLLPGGSSELLGLQGYLGGALVMGASVLASLGQQTEAAAGSSGSELPEQQPLVNGAGSVRQEVRASRRSSVPRRSDPEDP